jgi:hypothetical protein
LIEQIAKLLPLYLQVVDINLIRFARMKVFRVSDTRFPTIQDFFLWLPVLCSLLVSHTYDILPIVTCGVERFNIVEKHSPRL